MQTRFAYLPRGHRQGQGQGALVSVGHRVAAQLGGQPVPAVGLAFESWQLPGLASCSKSSTVQ